MLGHWEIIAILVVVVIIFGVGKLPKVLKQLGAGVKEFREAADGSADKKADAEAAAKDQQIEKNL
jgi:sec-independent protein translocase protein TatA